VSRLPLIIVGVVGLVVGAVAGGAIIGGDTKTEQVTETTTTVVTKNTGKVRTRTVRRGGGAAKTRTVTVTRTVEPYSEPGQAPPGAGRTVVNGTKTITGKGTKNFGTLKLGQNSTLNWTNSGAVFSIISESQLHVSSTKKKGSTRLYKGSYFNFRVAAVGNWKITISPR
jgi:hypothetical protein